MDHEVTWNAERSRYEITVDGEPAGVADVTLRGTSAVFPHTEVLPPFRGQGVAAKLVRAALDDVRAKGLQVVPLCWYVDAFLTRNPEYEDLRAGS